VAWCGRNSQAMMQTPIHAIFDNHHNNKHLPLTKNVCRRVTTLSLVKQQ
jgi:hypothetical protein